MVWARGQTILPAVIGLWVMGGVAVAHLIEAGYGGALLYASGLSLALSGVSAALLIPVAAMPLFAGVIATSLQPRH